MSSETKGRKRQIVSLVDDDLDERSDADRDLEDSEGDDRVGYGPQVVDRIQKVSVFGIGNTTAVSGGDTAIDSAVVKRIRTRRYGTRTSSSRVPILFLGADTDEVGHLRIDRESKAVEEAILRRRRSPRFELHKHFAVQVGDLQELLNRHQPRIVHFSGHGEVDVLHFDRVDAKSPETVRGRGLANWLTLFRESIRCVFLNACDTDKMAERLSKAVGCAIGMSRAVDDESAIELAMGFYTALAHGRTVGEAFDQARRRLDLQCLAGSDIPRLYCRDPEWKRLRF